MSNQFLEQIVVGAKVDTRGFKKADTALGQLNRNVKSLAKSFGVAYGTAQVIAYGKAAVKAFADDEAAAKRLAGAVNNLGIGFANPQISAFISNLEKTAGVADDVLRPAFQGLLTTTGSLVQSQKLLNDALTISRASGIDLATVSSDLAKGYVGITKGLSKYNTGLTKAELSSKSFADILDVLLQRSAGAAQDYLTTTSYKFDVLSVASQNASEIIGGGLVDAFALLAGGTDAKDAATAIETVAKAVANVERAIGRTVGAIPTLINNLKNLPKSIFGGFVGKQSGINTVTVEKKKTEVTVSQKRQQELLAKLEAASLKRNKELLALKNKQLATDKLKQAIDKANLALGKGEDIFNMDKIQIAAALANQAEQLGKATTGTQLLQIANDTARLNIKKDILDLEAAIAAGDQKAIEAATTKLNKDIEIFNALSKQSVKLADIKSILDTLNPKDLINQKNLDDALAKIKEMLALLAQVQMPTVSAPPSSGGGYKGTSPNSINTTPGTTVYPNNTGYPNYGMQTATLATLTNTPFDNGLFNLEDVARSSLLAGLTGGAGVAGAVSGARYAAQAANQYNITIQAGIGDPNAIADAVNQVLQDAVDRGTLRGGSY